MTRRGPSSLIGASLVLALFALAGRASAQAKDPAPEPPSSSDPGAVPAGASGAVRVPAQTTPEANTPVTPPTIVHFENAPYPPEAQKLGLEANVILRLDIDKDGKVTAAVVTEPAGHGFDEAAIEAAKKFLFEPARRGNTPIPARILYRYGFTLTPVAPETPAEPAPPPDNLRGVVRTADADVPLAGATIEVESLKGEHQTTTTGIDGTWKLSGLAAGHYKLSIVAPGFEPLRTEEDVVEGTVAELTYRLATKGEGLEVTVRGERPPREVTRRTIDQREMSRIPGTNGDALRSLQNLPGVGRPPGLAGLLIVRGSAPTDTQVFIDGIFVPLVYHFGGLSSVVPTEMLEKIDFYPGNFSAQYGRVMGGIVDVGIRSPNKDGKYHGLAQLDLIDGRVLAEGPIPGLKGVSFLAGARRSWVDTWLGPALKATGAGVTSAPVYYDYQAFIEAKLTSRSTLRLGAFGSDDGLEVLIKDPFEQDPAFGGNLALHTGFYRLEARYTNDISEQLKFSSTVSYGKDRFDFGLGTFFFRIRNEVLLNRTELSYRPISGLNFHAGVDLGFAPYSFEIRAPPPPRPGEPDPGPFAARPPIYNAGADNAWRPAAYLEAEVAPNERSKIVPGVRLDYARDTGHWDISPRISARYDIVHDFPRTTMKGGAGVYYQPPQYQETDVRFGTPGIYSNRAYHYSIGVEQEITRPIDVSLEGFYKQLDNLVARQPAVGEHEFVYDNSGKGSVVGAEVLLKYKPDARFFGWLAYTLSRSVRQNPPDFATTLFQYDQTHILTVLGSYRLGHGWEFGARFRLVSGSLITPNIMGIFNTDAGAYAPIGGLPFSQRLPMFHQLDLRVDKRWRFTDWSLSAYLDVQNAYNRANPEDLSYNYNYSQSQVTAFLPIIPSLGIRGEF
jgi:TonB family protein